MKKNLEKTIVTMIDKDGFNKKIVTYGNEPYSSDDSGDKLFAQVEWDYTNKLPIIFVYNIPSQQEGLLRAIGYVHTTNAAYEFNIGQKVTMSEAESDTVFLDMAYLYRPNAFMMDPTTAIENLDLSTVEDNNLHYSIYLIRMDIDNNGFTVIDRIKTISNLPATSDSPVIDPKG